MVLEVPGRYPEWQPEPGSTAARDLSLEIFSDKSYGLLHHPRSLCSLNLRSAAELLEATASLLESGSIFLAPAVLARTALENAIRGFLVLDPRVDARAHTARALLDDAAGAHFRRLSAKHLNGRRSEAFKVADAFFEAIKAGASEFFDCNFADDPHRWTVGSERYLRITDALRSWAEWRLVRGIGNWSADQAEGFYDYLSLYGHPQSYVAHPEANWGPGVLPHFRVEFDMLATLTLSPLMAVLDVARILYAYHGWDAPEVDAIGQAADAV